MWRAHAQAGADADLVDMEGMTALDHARNRGDDETIAALGASDCGAGQTDVDDC